MKKLRNSKKINIIIAGCLMFIFFFAGIFDSKTVKLDTEKNIIYQGITADLFCGKFKVNKNLAKQNDGNYFAIVGKVNSVQDNKLYLTGFDNNSSNVITCSFSAISIQNLFNGENVCVYGKFDYNSFTEELAIKGNRIEKIGDEIITDEFVSTLFGEKFYKKDTVEKNLANKSVKYYIPKQWKRVEHSIKGENLGSIEGYQYRLNEINNYSASPEELFVCYFDYSGLANESDANETKLIEKAIVANILKIKPESILGSFPLKNIKTYYDAAYQYYQSSFNKSNGKGYHVEFVFETVENRGMMVYLYVYENNTKNIEDIMKVLRMTEY